MFDGVHLGHQQVVRHTVADARQHKGISLVATFDKHPSVILAPAKAPRLIYSLAQKEREIEGLGADAILVFEFTREFSLQPGDRFIRDLVSALGHVQSISVGNNFSFGHKRSGNLDLLKTLGTELGFHAHGMASVSLGGQIVSSTRIRERIAAGELETASQMLGRTYSISGRVIRGDQIGRKLGFPTANIDVRGLVTPPHGVYAVLAQARGATMQGVVNIGLRPTINKPEPELRLEVHLLNFDGDLYDTEIEITFLDFLRPEQRFENLDQLKEQIARDISAARASFD
jgi:riboflavin kinase/FMN adenylyltransferase